MTTTSGYAVADYLASDGICEKQKRILNAKTAFKHFLRARGVSKQEIKSDFEGALERVPLSCLQDSDVVLALYLDECVKDGQLSARSASNIKSDFAGFLKFTKQQEYFRLNVEHSNRKYAPSARSGETFYGVRRGKGKNPKLAPYSLSIDQWSETAQKEHTAMADFWTRREVGNRQTPPIRAVSMERHTRNIENFFGFLINVLKGDLATLGITLEDLKTPLPSLKITKANLSLSLMTEVKLLQRFTEWGLNDRWAGTGYPPNSYRWVQGIVSTAKKIAQWLNRFMEDYDEAGAVKVLSRLLKRYRQRMKGESSKKEEILPSFSQCAMAVEWLRESCAPRVRRGVPRTRRQKKEAFWTYRRKDSAIARSWLRYLMCALLLYCAMRQRELRELELGRTLFRREDAYWIVLGPDDHKNGSKTGKSREYPIPDLLTADLDEWLMVWRPKIAAMVAEKYPQNEHNPNLVFCSLGSNSSLEMLGQPFKHNNLYSIITYSMYRATSAVFGKGFKVNPHLFRHIAVTHQREHGDPNQREALAEMMGHSLSTAEHFYKKVQSWRIAQKAKGWWKSYNPHARPNSANNKGE
ncbi:site-specific integrase [Leptolyngbya sp. CCNP1308]|uniref:site-specific integrase n=1 Tax=Leptolyngbya sp. CCNP1308 TaxID=3110255 RepID=UPI002B21301F|nr:site-specific integrase [Leptolyngbya sp. CCNP1308]MEA5448566.1 site-specific integrase [Leptolyngbya sp. CCNP1308]